MNQTLPRLLLLLLSLLTSAVVGGEVPLHERYHTLKSGTLATLPGTTIALTSTERDGVVAAEITSLLPHPFDTTATALARVENWCQFMPLHFNIKACTYAQQPGNEQLTLYSGRKTYQSPEESYALTYQVERRGLAAGELALVLHAARGPANTRDYTLELKALQVAEGTLVHIHSSYRPSVTSALLTRTYLATLGRDKIGFTRIEREGQWQPVQGVRGVIERNVMRYHLAIDTFLQSLALPVAVRREAALKMWYQQNERYPQQLHEMSESDYLAIKQQEWDNQQRLQQQVNVQQRVALR